MHLPVDVIDRTQTISCADLIKRGGAAAATLVVTVNAHVPAFSDRAPCKVLCVDETGESIDLVFFIPGANSDGISRGRSAWIKVCFPCYFKNSLASDGSCCRLLKTCQSDLPAS